jgi:hypothetical protein
MNIPWWGYVILAGLAWGTYVPIIFFGGSMLSPLDPRGNPIGVGGRLASILAVGVAYFVLAVMIPLALMALRDDAEVKWQSTGLVFSGLAGVMGAIGAICVIFASKAATDTAREEFNTQVTTLTAKIQAEPDAAKKAELDGELTEFKKGQKKYLASYRIYIAPLIFCLAPLINTLLSLVWHPDKDTGNWADFHFEMPSWHLPLGILLVAAGTFLVLYSKESAEANKPSKPAPQSAKPPVPAG